MSASLHFDQTMAALGFCPNHGKPGFHGDDLRFRTEGRWSVLTPVRCGSVRDALASSHLRKPGPWRMVSDGGGVRPVFELPASVPVPEAIGWARNTLTRNAASPRWAPPSREQVEAWVPDHGMTVGTRKHARQASIVRTPQRLAFEFTVASCPTDLAEERRRWLRTLLLDAQRRWRLVRVGFVQEQVVAQVDLTGAPHALLEDLVPVALDCLRVLVAWVLEPAQFLVDGSVGCRALSLQPTRA